MEFGQCNHRGIEVVSHSGIAMGRVGAAMEMVIGKYARKMRCYLCFGKCQRTSHVRDGYTDDTRSHRPPGAQLWDGLSRNWSVF